MPLGEKREARIHFSLHRAIQNVIEQNPQVNGVQFARTEPEYPVRGVGEADLVLFDRRGVPWLTIETKAATTAGDPFSHKVIAQAIGYASALGSYYFGTCDGRTFVLFDNTESGVPFWERKRIPPFNILGKDLEVFANSLLKAMVQLNEGTRKWSALDEAFVARLKFLHQRFVPYVLKSLRQTVNQDESFSREYRRWLEEQGFEVEEQSFRKTALEASYILINKILFYKVLETHYDIPKLKSAHQSAGVTETLSRKFRKILDIDYEAVFEPSIYDKIPLPEGMAEIVNDFLEEAGSYDISKIQSDVLGRIYEGLIPKDERRVLGQYYTPPPICDLIVQMCVRNDSDFVLDPGCGSGGFLIKAYHKLLQLKGGNSDAETHQEILKQLFGIDISHFPAHISVINLALRNITALSDMINVIPRDFFKVLPLQKTLLPIITTSIGEIPGTMELVPQFDAIVCNPPYTRQDEIGDEKYRDYIRKVSLTFDGKVGLSREAGVYAYFLTHSAHFLKEGGMMGYIVSNSWMEVRFGEVLKRFLLENFRIQAIIEFDRRAFEEAAINTVVIILRKEIHNDKDDRDQALVRFVRVKEALTTSALIRRVYEAEESLDSDDLKITVIKQADLDPRAKWLRYLRAPAVYFDLIKNSKMSSLSEVAQVRVGIITYANPFFLMTRTDAKDWAIEPEFLKPIVTSPKDVDFLNLTPSEVPDLLFVANKPKPQLKGTNALGYIEWGESATVNITRGTRRGTSVSGYHRIPSFRNKKIWYSTGEREPAPILVPRLMWERLFVARNDAASLANDRFYEIRPNRDSDVDTLLALLNSTVGRLFMEVEGRTTLGEGGLELMKYELDRFLVIDPAKIVGTQKKRLSDAVRMLEMVFRGGDEDAITAAYENLDTVVFECLGLDAKAKQAVITGFKNIQELRRSRVGVDVLLEHPERRKRIRRTRQKRISAFRGNAKSLDDFIRRKEE